MTDPNDPYERAWPRWITIPGKIIARAIVVISVLFLGLRGQSHSILDSPARPPANGSRKDWRP